MDVVPDGEPRFGYPNICDTSEIIELIAATGYLVLFTTGRIRHPDPSSRRSSRSAITHKPYARLSEDMDINAGRICQPEGASLDDVADDIIVAIKETASGRMTKANWRHV